MQEFEQKILEQYDIEVSSTRKVRGAVLCETNKGLFLLKEITTSEKRIPALCELYTRLYEQGYHRIDYVVTNRNGEYISALDNGDRYILKKCFAGRECDITAQEDWNRVFSLRETRSFFAPRQKRFR